jgi:glutamyl-Q tRNA(Asp) synthetase
MTPPAPIVSRFAPSPSGELHLGHAYAAIVAHDTARAQPRGRFIVRIDDIDPGRSRPEHVAAILADLAWLGLAWDGDPVFQSHRLDAYAAALDTLRSGGFAYPCFCTRADIAAEIAASDVAPHGPAASVYPGTCRAIPAAEARARCAGEPHCWRLDTARAADSVGPLDWHEEGAGWIAADPLAAGDIVLARKDAPASYHLANVVDDAALGVTLVVRGRDLFDATHVQRLLQALLGLRPPQYHHHALVVGADGKRLAKRDHAAGLATLRQGGVDGVALAADLRARRFPTGYSLANA